MARITFKHIAELAGVGTATVERVLNGRGSVSPRTAEKVIAAARRLKYPKLLPETYRGHRRIEVILVRPETTFFARLSRAFGQIAATLDPSISVHRTFLDEDDPRAIAEWIASAEFRRSGLILAVPDHPSIAEALAARRAEGLPIVQIVTRTEEVDDFVGIDNYAAGRTAGHFMVTMMPQAGTVVAVCHSAVYRVHRDRLRGFSDYLRDHARDGLTFAGALFGHDDATRNAEVLADALKRWPDLVGLYNVGGANRGLLSVLRKRLRGGRIFFVGHELTEQTAGALRDGTMSLVLDQAPEAQARRAVDLVLFRLGVLDGPVQNPPIRFITVTPENI